jgi:hypothetical protein
LGGGENVESAAQVLVALSALGVPVNDPLFVKAGKTVLDSVLSFVVDEGAASAAFSHLANGGVDPMATYQGLYALVALLRSLDSDATSLYDMSDLVPAENPSEPGEKPSEPGEKPAENPGEKPAEPSVSITGDDGVVEVDGVVSVTLGKTITFQVSGFEPFEWVQVVVHSTPLDLGKHQADEFGVVTVVWPVPADFEVGSHTVVFKGDSGKEVSEQFNVVAADPNAPTGGTASDASSVAGLILLLCVSGSSALFASARRRVRGVAVV